MGGEIVNLMPDSSHNASALVVMALACGSLVSAIVAITRRTALATALSMLAASLCLAGLYAGLAWHFLGAVQIMLWGGALLAFFVFNVISLNRDDTEPVALRGIISRTVSLMAAFFTLFLVVSLVLVAPWPASVAIEAPDLGPGSTAVLGRTMFGDLGFAMELLAGGLLLAVVAALSLTRVASAEKD
jgi:NADH:ubiquinone oxidoreductase subunit 6 (subunit J)